MAMRRNLLFTKLGRPREINEAYAVDDRVHSANLDSSEEPSIQFLAHIVKIYCDFRWPDAELNFNGRI